MTILHNKRNSLRKMANINHFERINSLYSDQEIESARYALTSTRHKEHMVLRNRNYRVGWRAKLMGMATAICAHAFPAYAAAPPKLPYAVGTGFYVTHDGYLLTANHVVANCSGPISVHGRMMVLRAKVVATDLEHDMALLRIITPDVNIPSVISFRSLNQPIQMGEPVIVTGYPSESMSGEFAEFITSHAKVTNTKSHIGDNSQFMFTYAAKSGFSGGPVLDASGNVLGMTASATCTSATCMEGFKKTFSMRASTVEEVEKLEETIAKHVDTNIAESLPVIFRFLESHKITYQESQAKGAPSADRISEIAESIANIRCPSEEKSLVEHSGIVRTK